MEMHILSSLPAVGWAPLLGRIIFETCQEILKHSNNFESAFFLFVQTNFSSRGDLTLMFSKQFVFRV